MSTSPRERPLLLLYVLVGWAALAFAPASRADLVPASLFQDHAVLQAGKPVPVWGRADAGEKVSVTFAGQTVATTTGPDGAWHVTLAPLAVSATPARMTLQGNNTLVLDDVLVGEVWLCSGQSNMEWKLNKTTDAEAVIAATDLPLVRQYQVRNNLSNAPKSAAPGKWVAASPATAGSFTGVGFYFARELHARLGVPVGIIHSSWGGTEIEAWMSPASMADPSFAFVAQLWQKRLDDYPVAQAKYEAAEAEAALKAAEAKAAGKTYRKPWRRAPAKPDGSPHETKPSAIYHGMIHPLAPAALAGVLWYQGESNAARSDQYRKLFPALIADWRTLFAAPALPFYWVQLPNYRGGPGEDWAALREAQSLALALPGTGQVIAIDVGDARDIHPINKRDVGLRLALLALRDTYNQPVIASGPRFAGASFSGPAVTVAFTGLADGLAIKGDTLSGFALAGANNVFHPADARLAGDTVVLTSAAVPAPVAVRYAWENAPTATLANSAGLPAAPFRTDAAP